MAPVVVVQKAGHIVCTPVAGAGAEVISCVEAGVVVVEAGVGQMQMQEERHKSGLQ